MTIKAFNVACLWFADKAHVSQHPAEGFDVKKYVEKVRAALSKVPGIDELKVEASGEHYNYFKIYDYENNEVLFYPMPFGFRCSFEVRIKVDIQHAYDIIVPTNVGTEIINVDIHYVAGAPVAYISTDVESKSTKPSDATFVLRKYLEDQVNKIDLDISLKLLGPSPFHSDFFIEMSDIEIETEYSFVNNSRPFGGYGSYLLKCNNHAFADIEDAYARIFIDTYQAVSNYYGMIEKRNSLQRHVHEIQELIDALLDIAKSTGPKGYYERLIL